MCAVGLGLLVYVYRRSRDSLAEMEIVRGALAAAGDGEIATEALQVDGRLGRAAAAWNVVLAEVDSLRQRVRTNAAVARGRRQPRGRQKSRSRLRRDEPGPAADRRKMCVRFSNGAAIAFLDREGTSLIGLADEKFRDALQSIAAGKLRRPVKMELEQPGEVGGGVLHICIRPVRRGDADSAMIIEDITQQRMAERARHQFINQVTHDLRTPLTNIRLAGIEFQAGVAAVRSATTAGLPGGWALNEVMEVTPDTRRIGHRGGGSHELRAEMKCSTS